MIDSVSGPTYSACRRLLRERLAERAPGRIQILTGPRQVGKTTLLLELQKRFPGEAIFLAGDDPAAALPGYWERGWQRAEEGASRAPALLIIDEVQHVQEWSARLKGQWDRIRRRKIPVHVIVSGSSSLRLGQGARESLAGRFEQVSLTHWPAPALAEAFDLPESDAVREVISWGSYPGARPYLGDPDRWRSYVRDAILGPALGRDLQALGIVRKPALLKQVFALAADMPTRVVSLQKLQGRLQDKGALETIAHYLELLEDSFLVAGLEKFSRRAVRRRAAPPKLVVMNNALISALHPEGPPRRGDDPERYGVWVENACLAAALAAGQRVRYWREEPLEVDGVIDGSWGSWAVEVRTGRFTAADLEGIVEFCRRNPDYRPLLVTRGKRVARGRELGLACCSIRDYLFGRLPSAQAT